MSNVSHLAQGQLQQGQKPHIPTLIILPLLGFYTSVLQTYSSLAEIVSQDSAIHLLVWSFPFALFAGEERKKMQSSMVDGGKEPIYLFGTIFLSSPRCSTESFEQRLTGLNCSLSLPHCLGWDPAGLAAPPPPGLLSSSSPPPHLSFISPQTENSPVILVCCCLYTRFNDVSNSRKDRPDLRELLHCS